MVMEIEKIHAWLLGKLISDGSVRSDTIQVLDEEDRYRAILFLDYLAGQNLLSYQSFGQSIEYKVENATRLQELIKPKPSTPARVHRTPTKLVYSAPVSLVSEVNLLVADHPEVEIVPLEDAFREIVNSARTVVSISSPFLEWDGLGYIMSELKSAAQRNIRVQLLTRGVILPERNADYAYLDKIKSLLKLHALFEAHASSPEARFEVRDFTTRISNPLRVSTHFEGIHQKMLIADRAIAYVGSGEIRAASFLINGECGVIQTGAEAAFWAGFFDIFWKSGHPVTKSQLVSALEVSSGRP